MLGDTFTGKTSLVLRFAEGYYRETGRSATVGAFFITKRLTVQGLTCKIQIWDTAGQEQYKKLVPMYYKNAAAAIVCYDTTSPASFETLKYWVDELRTNVPAGGIVLALCATKCDLEEESTDTVEAEALAAEVGAMFMRTSAKVNLNVNELFEKVAEQVLKFQRQGGGGSAIPVTLKSTPVEMYDQKIAPTASSGGGGVQPMQPSRIQTTTPPGQSDRRRAYIDEKKDEDDGLVDLIESKESTLESKSSCDASRLMCGDAEEMMGGGNDQNCIIL